MPMDRSVHLGCSVFFPILLCAAVLVIQAQGQDRPPSSDSQGADLLADHAADESPAEAVAAQPGPRRRPEKQAESAQRGLVLNTDAAYPGYTLFAPLNSTTTYLIDIQGQLAHSWSSEYVPGQAVYLLEDGSLLRCGRQPGNRHFGGGGIGGHIERLAPDGTVLWEYVCADASRCQHHDIEPLPNGHILLIAWEKKTREQVLAAGRDPEQASDSGLWPDCLLEVAPEGTSGGKIVWQWHVWDHLVQDIDKDKANYGVVADHPELMDLNYSRRGPRITSEEIERLRALGYVGGADAEEAEDTEQEPGFGPGGGRGPGGPDMGADWCHTNAVAYNAELDQIALSVHNFSEVWIIDHSTTTQEAAGHSGGRQGKGGDLLYRWGNPRTYSAGDATDQVLFAQHDVRWIPAGSPGAGHLMVFNNGVGRLDGQYSSVVEFAPPVSATGSYRLKRGQAFGPANATWEYTAADKQDLFSRSISGAQRLPNGNTLVCSGEEGRLIEVDASGKTVWEYVNPYIERGGPGGGFGSGHHGPGGHRSRGGPPGEGRRKGPPGGPGGGLFRATRFAPDHPGLRRLLQAASTNQGLTE